MTDRHTPTHGSKYHRLQADLRDRGEGRMTCFGHSMEPLLHSGDTVTFERRDSYEIGDVVFCKVRGRFIDAHRIIKRDRDRYLIANNKGHENGWTRQVFGRVRFTP